MKKTRKIFPNGFANWQETHFEVVSFITEQANISGSFIVQQREDGGIGRLYELAEDATDKFEAINKGREWDGDYHEAIDSFCKKELTDNK